MNAKKTKQAKTQVPVRRKIAQLSQEEILQIWTMRAGNKSNQDIAKHLNITGGLASYVITKRKGTNIPSKIKEAALATVIPNPKKKRTPSQPGLGNGMEKAVPEYFNACIIKARAQDRCIAQGITIEVLDALNAAARSQVDAEREDK